MMKENVLYCWTWIRPLFSRDRAVTTSTNGGHVAVVVAIETEPVAMVTAILSGRCTRCTSPYETWPASNWGWETISIERLMSGEGRYTHTFTYEYTQTQRMRNKFNRKIFSLSRRALSCTRYWSNAQVYAEVKVKLKCENFDIILCKPILFLPQYRSRLSSVWISHCLWRFFKNL